MGCWENDKACHVRKAVISLMREITAFFVSSVATLNPPLEDITLASILNCGHCKQARRGLDACFVDKR